MSINVPSVIHRIKNGISPACVDVCPTKCLYFGDLDDPNSDVSVVLKKRKSKTLIPEAGTDPQLYFLDLDILIFNIYERRTNCQRQDESDD